MGLKCNSYINHVILYLHPHINIYNDHHKRATCPSKLNTLTQWLNTEKYWDRTEQARGTSARSHQSHCSSHQNLCPITTPQHNPDKPLSHTPQDKPKPPPAEPQPSPYSSHFQTGSSQNRPKDSRYL